MELRLRVGQVLDLMNVDEIELELRHLETPLPGAGGALDNESGLRCKVVRLSRSGNANFGLHVGSAQGQGQPVRIHAVDPDSVAAKAVPKIEPGDVITTINKKFVLGLGATHQEITSLMRKSHTLEITLIEGAGFDQVKLASIEKDAGTPAGIQLSTGGDSPDTGYVHRVHKVCTHGGQGFDLDADG